MGNDLEIIKKIKKQFGKRLKKLSLEDIYKTENGYCMDKNGNIIGLNLYESYISDISFLKDLPHLIYLDLRGSAISDLSSLNRLSNLRELRLYENKISDLLPLNRLTNLTVLSLGRNQISDLSPLSRLTNLNELLLSDNKISDLSPLNRLINLYSLNLESNQILDISPLNQLINLMALVLGSNQIADLSPLKQLKKLYRLVLSNNNISQLPIELVQLGRDIKWKDDYWNGIFLEGNPLEIPPIEIVKQGTTAVRNYFKELEKETVRLLHSKLLIVGNGEVGKTTLMKKLKDNSFQVEVGKEETTHGINIVPWELQCPFAESDFEKVKINFWDFGGQDIYHATHQFFLTKRSLYLFVWEARKEEETRSFDYWLNIIKLLSAESPVIVVMNKADIRGKHIDEASFKDKFKNIVSFLQVSCVTGQGISELTGQIRTSLANMKHLRDKLPKVWMDIRDNLKKVEKDYISLEDYFTICKKHGLNEERSEFLSNYLHDLGVILHYRHDKLLENTVILNPEWATEAVYKLIDTREIFENKGRFRFDDLKTYWDLTRFPREKHAQLVRLMEKFELCFPITGTDIHIIPELLPAQRPSLDPGKYKKPDNLHFEYHYDFMPEGIITRFISRLYFLIKNDHIWKNGVELRFEDSTSLVINDLLNKKMKISITGSGKRELLAIIRNDFEHIHRTLNMEKNKHYHEMIPCGCSECRESKEAHLYAYETLKKYNDKKVPLIRCPKSIEEVSIEKLLKGLEPPKPKKDLLETLVTTASHLQGIARTIQADEDSRNGFIALLLSIHGFYVKDQTRRGRSATGKSLGELDILIETPGSEAESVIEAFILKSFNHSVIDNHVTKLFGYDPSGLKRNFIIVYSEASDFLSLWKKYLSHLPRIDFKYPLSGKVQEGNIRFTDIKLARTRHLREGELTEVYHIFINMRT